MGVAPVPPGPIAGLAFLAGRWRGTGEWGGRPFACRTAGAWLLGRYLVLDVHADQEGRAPHGERVIVHDDGERLVATLYPDRGPVQRFDVGADAAAGVVRFTFTPPAGSGLAPQRWTVRRTPEGYAETYELAPGGNAFQTSVRCSYVPEESA